ncbi:host cell division inhibitor Icd-like protein [Escherichia coli]|uniref:host cell division inhibitor Icd-like protein n=1 Tax=Escherichia coli TaxID=562 RepID=UPI002F96B3EA
MCFMVLPLRSNAFFCLSSCIGSYQYYNGNTDGNYQFAVIQYQSVKTAKPEGALTPIGLLTTTDSNSIEVAMSNRTTHPQGRDSYTLKKFTWRFLAINRHDKKAKPCRLSVEAETEREARSILAPHFILSLAARLPVVGGSYA